MITNYEELTTEIRDHLNRSTLASKIPHFIQYAESRIYADMNLREQEFRTRTTIDEEYADLPTDYLMIRDLHIEATTEGPLEYLSPKQMTSKFPEKTSGTPTHYTIVNNELEFSHIPPANTVLEIAYLTKFDQMSDNSDSTVLLVSHPHLYVYAALIAAEPYLKNDERVKTWTDLYMGLMKPINKKSRQGATGARLRARTNQATP